MENTKVRLRQWLKISCVVVITILLLFLAFIKPDLVIMLVTFVMLPIAVFCLLMSFFVGN